MSMPAAFQQWLDQQPAQTLAAGAVLQPPDQRARQLWWVRSGLLRSYVLAPEGNEYNLGFTASGQWASAQVQLSPELWCCEGRALGVSAVLPSAVVAVALTELQSWRNRDPAVNAWLVEQLLLLAASSLTRAADLVQRSAEQRYLDWLAAQPQLASLVPQKQIAAWLGITPVALSRIRRRLRAREASAAVTPA